MFNIFSKALVVSILDSKVESREIISYRITENELHINKRGKVHKIDITGLSGDELAKVLYREIPKDISNHFKVEIRNIKIRKIING